MTEETVATKKGFPLAWKIILGFIILILLIMVIDQLAFDGRYLSVSKSMLSGKRNCQSDKKAVLTAELTDRNKVQFIYPVGNTQDDRLGGGKIVVKQGEKVPVYNPAIATVENATDGLRFKTNCDVTYIIDGLDELTSEIKNKSEKTNTKINRGELLGYVSAASQGDSFTITILDKAKSATYINPARWQDEKALYAKCPYDYFDSEDDNNLRRNYLSFTLINNENVIQRVWTKEQGTSSIACGDISHDIEGTVSGGWFKGGSTDIKGDFLSLNKYLSTVQISFRQNGRLVESLTDYAPDVLLSEVKQGSSACYHDANQDKWTFVKFDSDSKISLAKGSGTCPGVFPATAETWER